MHQFFVEIGYFERFAMIIDAKTGGLQPFGLCCNPAGEQADQFAMLYRPGIFVTTRQW